jgi:hypothetical protein
VFSIVLTARSTQTQWVEISCFLKNNILILLTENLVIDILHGKTRISRTKWYGNCLQAVTVDVNWVCMSAIFGFTFFIYIELTDQFLQDGICPKNELFLNFFWKCPENIFPKIFGKH